MLHSAKNLSPRVVVFRFEIAVLTSLANGEPLEAKRVYDEYRHDDLRRIAKPGHFPVPKTVPAFDDNDCY
jgi:hypothetical protein